MFLASAEQLKQQLQSILTTSILANKSLTFKEYIHKDQHAITLNLNSLLKTQLLATSTTTHHTTELIYLAARSIQFDILSLPIHAKFMMRNMVVFLDIILSASELEIIDQITVFQMIEEALEIIGIPDAELLFEYLEERLDRLVVNLVPNKGKALVLLRFCNELMRRLSKVKNIVFCGKILILLAIVFPLNERSGVNRGGAFHKENVTLYEQDDEMNTDETTNPLYTHIWKIQRYLCNPTLLFLPVEFGEFKLCCDEINTAFQKIAQKDTKLTKKQTRRSVSSGFFPKYLTGRNLFDLEIKDPSFRNQILMQLLIVTTFLATLSKSNRLARIELLKGLEVDKIKNASVDFQHEFDEHADLWINQTRIKITDTLNLSSVNGVDYLASAESVISNEHHWDMWKLASCQRFEMDRETFTHEENVDYPKSYQSTLGARYLGNDDMTQLWNHGLFLDKSLLTRAKPVTDMNLVDYLEPLNAQLDANGEPDGIEDEYRHDKDDMYNWRAYRIGLKHNIQLMQTSADNKVNAKNLLMSYRKSVQVLEVEKKDEKRVDDMDEEIADTDMVGDERLENNETVEVDEKIDTDDVMVDVKEEDSAAPSVTNSPSGV